MGIAYAPIPCGVVDTEQCVQQVARIELGLHPGITLQQRQRFRHEITQALVLTDQEA